MRTIHHPQLWEARLELLRDVFPWITNTKKELAGLSPDDDLTTVESAKAFLQVDEEYKLGSRSSNKAIRDLHIRQNEEWTKLTGLGPLGTVRDWKDCGLAANAPNEAIDKFDLGVLQDWIGRWARVLASDAKESTRWVKIFALKDMRYDRSTIGRHVHDESKPWIRKNGDRYEIRADKLDDYLKPTKAVRDKYQA